MRVLNPHDFRAAADYAARNPSDPYARARALNRLRTGLCTKEDLKHNRTDNYAPPEEQYIVKELEAAEEAAFKAKKKRDNA